MKSNQMPNFSPEMMENLESIMNQYATKYKYGIGAVLEYKDGDRRPKYNSKTKNLLIPRYNRPVEGYMTCRQFAWEAAHLFHNAKFPEIKSCAFVAGSDDKYAGHCIFAISTIKDFKLTEFNGDHPDGNDYIEWYLNQCILFDICELRVSEYSALKFNMKYFTYIEGKYCSYEDSVSQLKTDSFTYLGVHKDWDISVMLDRYSNPCLRLGNSGGQMLISTIHDLRFIINKFPELDTDIVHNAFKWYCSIQWVTNIYEDISFSKVLHY